MGPATQFIYKRCPENKEQILTALDKQARELAVEIVDMAIDLTVANPTEKIQDKIKTFATQVREQTVAECAEFVDDFDEIETYGGYYQQDNARATLTNCAGKIRALAAPLETTEQERKK